MRYLLTDKMPQAVAPAGQDAPAEGGSKWTGIARSMAMFMAMQMGKCLALRAVCELTYSDEVWHVLCQ